MTPITDFVTSSSWSTVLLPDILHPLDFIWFYWSLVTQMTDYNWFFPIVIWFALLGVLYAYSTTTFDKNPSPFN